MKSKISEAFLVFQKNCPEHAKTWNDLVISLNKANFRPKDYCASIYSYFSSVRTFPSTYKKQKRQMLQKRK